MPRVFGIAKFVLLQRCLAVSMAISVLSNANNATALSQARNNQIESFKETVRAMPDEPTNQDWKKFEDEFYALERRYYEESEFRRKHPWIASYSMILTPVSSIIDEMVRDSALAPNIARARGELVKKLFGMFGYDENFGQNLKSQLNSIVQYFDQRTQRVLNAHLQRVQEMTSSTRKSPSSKEMLDGSVTTSLIPSRFIITRNSFSISTKKTGKYVKITKNGAKRLVKIYKSIPGNY